MDKETPEQDTGQQAEGRPAYDGSVTYPGVDIPRTSALEVTADAKYRSRMLRRLGGLYYLSGLFLALRKLRLEEHSAENIRRASAKGPVVYVLHTRSYMDWVALNRVLNARRLPLAGFTNGMRNTRFAPIAQALTNAWLGLRQLGSPAPDPVTSGWLSEAVAAGMPTALFLLKGSGDESGTGLMRAIFEAQARCRRPIQLVPVVVVWTRAPAAARSQVGRFLLGTVDRPGPLQKLFAVATRDSDALVQAGAPIDLVELLERYVDVPRERQVRIARVLLRRYLYREATVVRGPNVRSHRWTRRLVLSSPEVRQLVAEESAATGKTEADVRLEVEKTLDHIATRFSFPLVRVARKICEILWNRIFSGIDVRDEDIERVREAVRNGSAVLVPCHRSHLDYLLLSSVLIDHDVAAPHIVAGENLAFWPMGHILRRMGAFFIRRSFKGERIFPVVFARYVKQLVRDSFTVEFFIEGGRSRTGKLLPPKLGVLSMLLEAAADRREDREVSFLPIGISYVQIAEEGVYARELAGKDKQKEDIKQLVKATRVVTRRFGKVYLRVGEPLTAREVFGEGSWDELDRDHRAELTQRIGERLMYRIAQNMVALPTGIVAMGLLAQSRRGIRMTELNARVQRFFELLRRQGARTSVASAGSWITEEAVKRFEKAGMIKRIEDDQGGILQVIEDKRITLEYYKNGIIHFLATASLMAAAIKACRASGPMDPEVSRLFFMQSFMLRYEFTQDPEASLDDLERGAIESLVEYGALARADGRLVVADKARVVELAEVTRNLLESYMLVLRAAVVLQSRDIPQAELPKRVQAVGEGLLAVDELLRPEALSVANLQNAVKAFLEEDVIQVRTGGGGLQFDEPVHSTYIADLSRLLT